MNPPPRGSKFQALAPTARAEFLPATSGSPAPLGAGVTESGVNFSLYSRCATAVELLFFDREDDVAPSRIIPLDPARNRTYHYWHAFVPVRDRGNSTVIASRGLRLPSAGSVLIHRGCCSIPTAVRLSFRRTIRATMPA